MCVFIFSTNFAWNIFHCKINWARCGQRCILVFMQRSRYSRPILMSFNFLDRFSKSTRIQSFTKIRHLGTELFHADRQTHRRTDMTKLTVAFAILKTRLKMIPRWFWEVQALLYDFRFAWKFVLWKVSEAPVYKGIQMRGIYFFLQSDITILIGLCKQKFCPRITILYCHLQLMWLLDWPGSTSN